MVGTAKLAVFDPYEVRQQEVLLRLRAATRAEFLDLLSWDSRERIARFPKDHPELGRGLCPVPGCGQAPRRPSPFCQRCASRHAASGLSVEEFAAVATVARGHGTAPVARCRVAGCSRVWVSPAKPLCNAHQTQRRVTLKLPLEEFLAHPWVRAMPPLGPCLVVACSRERTGREYCKAHTARFKKHSLADAGFDEQRWRRTESAIPTPGEVSLRGLPDLVVAEVLYGLQERVRSGAATLVDNVRTICDKARMEGYGSLVELSPGELSSLASRVCNTMVTYVRRALMTPETERRKDVWDLSAFGMAGRSVRFTGIGQPWLREATKRWAFDSIVKRRGANAAGPIQYAIQAVAQLSESLRLQREDRGEHPGPLGARDIEAFLHRLTFLADDGQISPQQRHRFVVAVRGVLDDFRTLGLTRPDGPLAALPGDFAISRSHLPERPEESEAGKNLPTEILRVLCQSLDQLEAVGTREHRVAFELLIDTGRRPAEICALAWDCLERDGDGRPVLIYDNIKSNRLSRRLPIAEATAQVIATQQVRVRERFPDTPLSEMKLLPGPAANRGGTKPVGTSRISTTHRNWLAALPELTVQAVVLVDGEQVATNLPYDKKKIIPYAYRHSYAQRHADAGVPVDVLRDLMDHKDISTTQAYYRVGETRRREAVNRVSAMQFDRHGNRTWRDAKGILDAEHVRLAIGEVAVPYGVCLESSNVAAGGGACPIRFRCVGCDHFRSNPSYLPELETYLADLLRNRERLLSAFDADDWAIAEAMPSQKEIDRVRQLINSIKAEMDELTGEQRAQIEQAVAVVRRTRQAVDLGIPTIRQPLPDLRPDRSA